MLAAKKFSIAVDGSCYNSGASHTGVKVCGCKSKGIYYCQCPRRYSDPDARWGWDSYHEEYFFGDTLFSITASDSPYDLPVYLRIAQATRHDSILSIFALNEVRKLYPDITFRHFIADGAMDNYPTYQLLHQWNMIPYIPLDSRTRMDYKKPHPGISCFDDKGRPICLGGIPYEHIGYSYPKGIKYRCWFDCKGIDKPCKCSDSNYGRTIYIKPDYDFRLFPPVPRNSESFKRNSKQGLLLSAPTSAFLLTTMLKPVDAGALNKGLPGLYLLLLISTWMLGLNTLNSLLFLCSITV